VIQHRWRLVRQEGTETEETCDACGTTRRGPWFEQASGACPLYTFYLARRPFIDGWDKDGTPCEGIDDWYDRKIVPLLPKLLPPVP
jgi:hypothetical protein